mmetsp:Transcript_18147/g.29502  ORF Transcript_18147/g.29502 Transcript_18147/m.29502 type:complete len:204 (-) Transcript_18147:242-853(-)|eukprot:CAMPEP_0169062942 /NCGR_PEP_ID=MMETSP1015-20121227/987_1 /TAXON_ID=342587 /ORGANISM="Karlodinium micrum, Strain CCMP2283" /LENGTH=203 /DNA_ID=CAMNT_0009121179 /DNA_START=427 /DNA_END=1038 /DNA_ORIENTATION=-
MSLLKPVIVHCVLGAGTVSPPESTSRPVVESKNFPTLALTARTSMLVCVAGSLLDGSCHLTRMVSELTASSLGASGGNALNRNHLLQSDHSPNPTSFPAHTLTWYLVSFVKPTMLHSHFGAGTVAPPELTSLPVLKSKNFPSGSPSLHTRTAMLLSITGGMQEGNCHSTTSVPDATASNVGVGGAGGTDASIRIGRLQEDHSL